MNNKWKYRASVCRYVMFKLIALVIHYKILSGNTGRLFKIIKIIYIVNRM